MKAVVKAKYLSFSPRSFKGSDGAEHNVIKTLWLVDGETIEFYSNPDSDTCKLVMSAKFGCDAELGVNFVHKSGTAGLFPKLSAVKFF